MWGGYLVHSMFNPSSMDDAVPFPSELNLLRVQAASVTTTQRPNSLGSRLSGKVVPWKTTSASETARLWRSPEPDSSSAFSDYVGGSTAPLAQLWERDVKALGGFFDREDMHDIETDVIRNLLARWPEPCWEDDPFDFLREFL